MESVLISLGANLGDRRATLAGAIARLKATTGIHDLRVGSFHETTPVGGPPGQPPFLNAALAFRSSLPPEGLLDRLQAIELEFGRTREVRWDARTLDLDILLWGARRFETDRLSIPHPRLAHRRFVLDPAIEVAGNWLHPDQGCALHTLREQLNHPERGCYVIYPAARRNDLDPLLDTIHPLCKSVALVEMKRQSMKHRADLFLEALDTPPGERATNPCWLLFVLSPPSDEPEWKKRFREGVKRLGRRGQLGPVVWLASDSIELACAEAAAAIQGARGS